MAEARCELTCQHVWSLWIRGIVFEDGESVPLLRRDCSRCGLRQVVELGIGKEEPGQETLCRRCRLDTVLPLETVRWPESVGCGCVAPEPVYSAEHEGERCRLTRRCEACGSSRVFKIGRGG